MSKQNAALALASRGLLVFPITPQKKFPPLVAWKSQATTNPDIIKKCWEQSPNANIGVATGKTSGMFVFDVDMKKGKNGEAELRKLEEQHGKLPPTVETITPHRGRQLWFKQDGEVKCSTDKIGIGLDVKGDGGYVLAPPSFVSDDDGAGGYAWSVDSAKVLAVPPTWLLLATCARKEPHTAGHWNRITAGVADGSRHEDLNSLIGKLILHLPPQSVLNVALAVNARNSPPLDEDDVEKMVNSLVRSEAMRRGWREVAA